MAILEAHGVEYTYTNRYQTTPVLHGVSYAFDAGRFYAIVGPSGCGKTTFLSLLAGLDLPRGGEITFDGRPLDKLNRDSYRLSHAAVIYQNYNLFAHLTALENAAYPLYLRGMSREEADGAAKARLDAVGITPEQYRRFPAMLSGGEQQRVAIARALVSGAEVILGDEPTGNLDGVNTDNILAILQRLAHEEGRCVIVVTHDGAVADAADAVLRIERGRVKGSEK